MIKWWKWTREKENAREARRTMRERSERWAPRSLQRGPGGPRPPKIARFLKSDDFDRQNDIKIVRFWAPKSEILVPRVSPKSQDFGQNLRFLPTSQNLRFWPQKDGRREVLKSHFWALPDPAKMASKWLKNAIFDHFWPKNGHFWAIFGPKIFKNFQFWKFLNHFAPNFKTPKKVGEKPGSGPLRSQKFQGPKDPNQKFLGPEKSESDFWP